MLLNLNTRIWGPYFWFTIETIAFSFPNNPSPKTKKKYKNFIYSFKYILPCIICRKHFKKYIKLNPLNDEILSKKKLLIDWIIQAHNNASNKSYTYDSFIKYYTKIYWR